MPPTARTTEAQPQQPQMVLVQPIQTPEYLREQEIRRRAARRRDPDAHVEAQMQLDAMPKLNVILEPNDDERRYGEAHLNTLGDPQYPKWQCTYNGLRLEYPMGEEIQVPQVIWEIYAHSRRLPRHRTLKSATAGVFSRDIPEDGALTDGAADFGR